jgi:hypothetical protein
VPLLTTASGEKMGKTADGAVWLDPARTPPFAFYQYWLNLLDADVERFLRYFTFLGAEEITAVAAAHAADPAKRAGQRRLAEEVTRFVHGPEALDKAQRVTRVLFEVADWRTLDARDLEVAFEDAPKSELAAAALGGPEAALTAVLAGSGLFKSKTEARTGIEPGRRVGEQPHRALGPARAVARRSAPGRIRGSPQGEEALSCDPSHGLTRAARRSAARPPGAARFIPSADTERFDGARHREAAESGGAGHRARRWRSRRRCTRSTTRTSRSSRRARR